MPLQEMTIVDIREQIALRALDGRYSVSEVADLVGVTRPTVRLWRDRYRTLGRAGLEDRSHAPHSCPHRTSEAIEQLIIKERKRWGWGSKKILNRLEEAHPQLQLPRRSTVDAILARHHLIERRRRQRGRQVPFIRRYEATEPGELTTIDFKGEFRLGNGHYCYPLTIVDNVSRFLLACHGLPSTELTGTWPLVERVFREHGLPLAMQSDNGPPFGPLNGSFSAMSVRLMRLDVLPVFSRPARPSDNGRHERMHRDLKRETTRPPCQTFRQQQRKFDDFRRIYNEERPHEGIAMQRPIRLYKRSRRPFPSKIKQPEYPGHCEVRKVWSTGHISWRGRNLYLSEAFAGQYIGLDPTDDGIWSAYFYRFAIGKIDERGNNFL